MSGVISEHLNLYRFDHQMFQMSSDFGFAAICYSAAWLTNRRTDGF